MINDLKHEIDALIDPDHNLEEPDKLVPFMKRSVMKQIRQCVGLMPVTECDFHHYIGGGWKGFEKFHFNEGSPRSLDEWMRYERKWNSRFTQLRSK